MKTWLVVGLGNPEGKYFQTYHNVGFLAADSLANRLELQFKKKGNQLITEHKFKNTDSKLIVLKPLTYMNLSGQAVLAVARKYKIAPENIIVFTDDLYIDKGNIRISLGGSGGGHNGIRSINELLKTNQYIKLRIGILSQKQPKNGNASYVLTKIDGDSRVQIDTAIQHAVDCALSIVQGETISKLQGIYNKVNKSVQDSI